MIKSVLTFAISAFLLVAPMDMKAQDIQRTPVIQDAQRAPLAQDVQRSTIEQEADAVAISVTEASNVRIKNAEKQVLEIYNMAGVKVATFHLSSPDERIGLDHLSKGCYILKVGKVARKVYLR